MAARVHRGEPKRWQNYHETVSQRVSRLEILDHLPGSDAPAWLKATARLVGGELARGRDIRPLGASWSFSKLSRTAGDIFSTRRLSAVWPLPAAGLAPGLNPATLRLASSGTRIKSLNVALEGAGLSLRTSGASNGQSIAGAIATGTHGSVPSVGGIQTHARGMHLVTGPDRSVWLEPAPMLARDFTRGFADEHVTDAALFDAALVHLGGMGFVNAVLLDVAPAFLLGIVQRKAILPWAAIDELQTGDFAAFAARLGFPEPYFVQVILNPFNPGRKALVRLLVPVEPEITEAAVLDILRGLFELDPLNVLGGVIAALPPGKRGEIVAILMRAAYPTMPREGEPLAGVPWGVTTPDHRAIGDLYSTGIAIERGRLREALDVMLPAFRKDGGGDTVCTLRFVARSPGALAVTRWEHNVVVDFDGLRTDASRAAYGRVLKALDDAGIPSRQHWGKLSLLDAARVRRDHGDAAVDTYRAARERLLGPATGVFRSKALIDWGLA